MDREKLVKEFKAYVREVPDFPKKGILFQDITPVLAQPELLESIADLLVTEAPVHTDAVMAIEARGFLFGMLLATRLGVPFIPVRKKGKLPFHTVSYRYRLEYGEAEVEMHADAVEKGWNVLIHDDLLATGGTAAAAARLAEMQGATVAGFSFLIELDALKGRQVLSSISNNCFSILRT